MHKTVFLSILHSIILFFEIFLTNPLNFVQVSMDNSQEIYNNGT